MDGFGWMVVVILVLLFGKNISATTAAVFNQPNAVPSPDVVPGSTIQNQGNSPITQPPPWSCNPNASPFMPVNNNSHLVHPVSTALLGGPSNITQSGGINYKTSMQFLQ